MRYLRAMTRRTTILPATPAAIARAAELIRAGRLVAFPTETVYGLGADATDDRAVAAIFAAKRRPTFNPLIVHVADLAMAEPLAAFDDRARAVAARFWPGALTLVLPRSADSPVSLLATAGLDTLAVRVPAHPVAHALLVAARTPIAAPSANPSGRISPTEAAHVEDMPGLALVLDGGPCRIGIESTIIDLSAPRAAILRPGGVAREDLESVLGPLASAGNAERPTAPGQLESHYAPALPVRLNATGARPGEALLGFGPGPAADLNLSPGGDLAEAAANLFAMLRALDRPDFAAIAVTPIPDHGLGAAINDRLRRAAAPRPVSAAAEGAAE